MFQNFDWDLTHQVFFPYIFPSHHMNLREQHDWKMLIRWCRTDIYSCKIFPRVSLMLDNPFIVPSLCKLNHISLCFIQISTKSAYSLLESNVFFEVIPGVLGHSVNFNITSIFLLRWPVFPDYLFLVTMIRATFITVTYEVKNNFVIKLVKC